MKKLLREDFDAGPISINEIEPGLWLGNHHFCLLYHFLHLLHLMFISFVGNLTAALDVRLIEKYSITHILTVDSCPLPSNILMLPSVTTKFFQSI